ncbi:RICIN domain-containing protein [Phaeospirillum tilakii]|uniref:RICIN domain-containing protein n=1 Tax=Phaeospirillum tilakii TaxID=741673 RepID=A0ABW5CD06_9PROT
MSFDPRKPFSRVRILNNKSGLYLGLEGKEDNWSGDDTSLAIRQLDSSHPDLESPQVWSIIQYRPAGWIMLNQFSMKVACIRDRSTDNGATAIQYHTEGLSFQQWNFVQQDNQTWLIQNLHSNRFIGPQGRSVQENHYVIQWNDQSGDDTYQAWTFQEVVIPAPL